MSTPPPSTPPPAPPTGGPAPGWYPDPGSSDAGHWRWWDGFAWTATVHHQRRKPRLPAWLSVPVLVSAVLVVPLLIGSLLTAPLAVLLPIPTFVVVVAAFVWFDRLEPEPWQQRIHAMLWGGTVAIVGASIVNASVGAAFGEVAMVVVSAPIIEELLKGAAILVAVKRGMVDSVTDGIVYAGWVAAGFAAVENVEYLLLAALDGQLVGVFVIRGLLAPFAHPLFTIWIGVAIGRAVVRGRDPRIAAIPGLLVAIALHAAWNGATVLAELEAFGGALLLALGFIALFIVTAVLLIRQRQRGRRELAAAVPAIATRYHLTPSEVLAFSDWRRTLATRRALPRGQRSAYDARHAAVSRLAAMHLRGGPRDATHEAQLLSRLREARQV
ncbi:MAG: PrsW family intramembrane metalloprotease [Nitriliruptoraceae bacterium]|nr:PrsW family intramembrane metalloprotease [Nitriliruptoraceae bacterium]